MAYYDLYNDNDWLCNDNDNDKPMTILLCIIICMPYKPFTCII